MKAMRLEDFGGIDSLAAVDVPVPDVPAGGALVAIQAAGVNPGELNIAVGRVPEAGRPPLILGSDVAGVVKEVSDGVVGIKPGDEVYGMVGLGGYAEFVAAPADFLAAKPDNLDFVHAAALPLAALTAWTAAVRDEVAPGSRVLVHAAAGGVGHIAVQLAKRAGATVVATARPEKHDYLRELGVDEAIDYTSVDFAQAAGGIDVVIDLVGGDYGLRSLDVLRAGGLLVSATLTPGLTVEDAAAKGRRSERIIAAPSGEVLRSVAGLIEAGELRVSVAQTFPLGRLAEAYETIASRRVLGKLVVTP